MSGYCTMLCNSWIDRLFRNHPWPDVTWRDRVSSRDPPDLKKRIIWKTIHTRLALAWCWSSHQLTSNSFHPDWKLLRSLCWSRAEVRCDTSFWSSVHIHVNHRVALLHVVSDVPGYWHRTVPMRRSAPRGLFCKKWKLKLVAKRYTYMAYNVFCHFFLLILPIFLLFIIISFYF